MIAAVRVTGCWVTKIERHRTGESITRKVPSIPVLQSMIYGAVVIATIGRHRTPVPIVDQQSQTQLGRLLVPGMARPFLLCAVGYHTMAQIAPKNRIMVRNSVER